MTLRDAAEIAYDQFDAAFGTSQPVSLNADRPFERRHDGDDSQRLAEATDAVVRLANCIARVLDLSERGPGDDDCFKLRCTHSMALQAILKDIRKQIQ